MLLNRTQYLLALRQQIILLLLGVVEAVRATEVVVAVVGEEIALALLDLELTAAPVLLFLDYIHKVNNE